MNYYKRHVGDIAGDLSHLSQGAFGAYDLLMDWYYKNEKPLPADADDIYNITRARTATEKKNAAKARAFFRADGTHPRCDAEIEAYNAKASKNREVGRLGGRPSNPNGNPNGFHSETETVSKNNPSHKPLTNIEKEQKKEQARSPKNGSRLPTDFPDETLLDWAKQERPDVDSMMELEKFRDYWTAKPGKDGRKLDWPATWRNWIRGARASQRAGPIGGATSKTGQAIETLERMKRGHQRSDSGTPTAPALPWPGKTACE